MGTLFALPQQVQPPALTAMLHGKPQSQSPPSSQGHVEETIPVLGNSALASKATSHILFLVSDALFIVICLSSVSHGEFQLPVLTTLYTVPPLMPTSNGNTYFFC